MAIWILAGLAVNPVFSAETTPQTASGSYLNYALIDGSLVQRWHDDTREIRVYFHPGQAIAGWSAEKERLVKAAFSQWESALDHRFQFVFTPHPQQADIEVTWHPAPKGLQIGHQNISWRNNLLTQAEIEISLFNPEKKPLSNLEIQYVAMHEIGHVLGIRGHSPNPSDIMYPTLQPKSATLSSGDIATMKALYNQTADITNPTRLHLAEYQVFNQYILLGYEAHKQGDYPLALEHFRKAMSMDPQDENVVYYVGISAYNIKNYLVAIEHLERAAQISGPDQVSAQYYLASALTAQGALDIINGSKAEGLHKLYKAKKHYDTVLNNPLASLKIRQMASTQIHHLASFKPN